MGEIGYTALILSLIISAYAIWAAAAGGRWRSGRLMLSAERSALTVGVLLSLSAFALFYALISRDFSLHYVVNYTSSDLPFFYTITAFWAGQAGSLLFWVWLLSIFLVVVVWQARRGNRQLLPYILATNLGVIFFFVLLLVFYSNPFAKLHVTAGEGRGLNPLLQNPGMVFHPPLLFLGYVGFTIPFSFAIAALITGNLGDKWIKSTRRWTLFSWFFLTLGNLTGAAWAYVELGWGGYWAWDPVENAAFMPWLTSTAFLHSVMIQEKRGMLKKWNIVLIVLTFALTIFGTFITRSGIISSVHSFGVSRIGPFFLVFLAIVISGSIALLLFRLPALKGRDRLDSLLSKESSFLFNNLILVSMAFAIFWGTVFPLISEALTGDKISVGPPFFNQVIVPIGLFLLLLIGVCPLIAWHRASFSNFKKSFLIPTIISLIGGIVLLIVFAITGVYVFLYLTLSIFVTFTILVEFYRGVKARRQAKGGNVFSNLWVLVIRNRRRYGGYIIHLGVVMIVLGITGSSGFKQEKVMNLKRGEKSNFGSYVIMYEDFSNYTTENKEVTQAVLGVYKHGQKITTLLPGRFLYFADRQSTSEVAVYSTLSEDLYVILNGYDENQDISVKIFVNPLVVWIWNGGIVIALGFAIVIWGKKQRVGD